MKPFFVYMLRCGDGSFYVGHTDDLELRVAKHVSGEIPGYTRDHLPVTFVWSQETATRDEALAAERRIKGWARAKKEALVDGDWKAIQRHAWGTRNPMPSHLREPGEDESLALHAVRPEVSKASDEREHVRAEPAAPGPSIPQDERVGVLDGQVAGAASLPSVRMTESASPPSVRTEVSKSSDDCEHVQAGPAALGPSIPQDERGVAVVGQVTGAASLPSVRMTEAGSPPSVRTEVSKSSDDLQLIHALLHHNRRALAKTITLLESTRPDHRARADTLLDTILPHTGRAIRLGISGVPGVGKSTFIEALGLHLIAQGHRVAVLAIDPSSSVSGGSILGDKTRMEQLSIQEAAFIRPSPASGTLGGVAEKTREAMLVCEAAGHDVVIVETVGVGQSEIAVAGMTDMFVLMQLPNAGDDLQAIKKGVMEIADLVVVNKADIDPAAATRAEAQLTSSLRLLGMHARGAQSWTPRVMRLSAIKADGIAAFWQHVEDFHRLRRADGQLDARRKQQALAWMWDLIHARLHASFREHPAVRGALALTTHDVADARIAPSSAARRLLTLFQPG